MEMPHQHFYLHNFIMALTLPHVSPHIKKSPLFNFPLLIRTVDTGPFPLSIFDSTTTPFA